MCVVIRRYPKRSLDRAVCPWRPRTASHPTAAKCVVRLIRAGSRARLTNKPRVVPAKCWWAECHTPGPLDLARAARKFGRNVVCIQATWALANRMKNEQVHASVQYEPRGSTIYFQFISIINLYMFRAGLLLISRRHCSLYTAVGCHAENDGIF